MLSTAGGRGGSPRLFRSFTQAFGRTPYRDRRAEVLGGGAASSTAAFFQHQHPINDDCDELTRRIRHQTRVHDDPGSVNASQLGYGKVVALSSRSPASSATVQTYLTELRHSSPMRLVPSRRSTGRKHRRDLKSNHDQAALLHLSSYGGGLVPGDSLVLDVEVGPDASLVILTQGGQRIYRPGKQFAFKDYSYSTSVDKSSCDEVPDRKDKLCRSSINCRVKGGASLYYLPDPTVPYNESAFREERVFSCMEHGSIIAVDWYSSGRRFSTGMGNERWAFDYLATRTELSVGENGGTGQSKFVEALEFDGQDTRSNVGKKYESMASLLLHGPASSEVVTRAKQVSLRLASMKARVRLSDIDHEDEEITRLVSSICDHVLLSVTAIDSTLGSEHDPDDRGTHLVRILAGSNEDVYRLLHFCLKPCSSRLGGLEPYKERIHSSRTVRQKVGVVQSIENSPSSQRRNEPCLKDGLEPIVVGGVAGIAPPARTCINGQPIIVGDHDERNHNEHQSMFAEEFANRLIFGEKVPVFSRDAWFRLCTLSDSALPVGSFAHSQGIEAASQMGLFESDDDGPLALASFLQSLSRSSAQFATPVILAGYSLLSSTARDDMDLSQIRNLWAELDARVDTRLRSNDPSRRASMDQGLGLIRVSPSFNHQQSRWSDLFEMILSSIDTPSGNDASSFGHSALIYGILCASLRVSPIDACRVYSFGATRDAMSAAVRLNLTGPLEGLAVMDEVGHKAVEQGIIHGMLGIEKKHSGNGLDPREISWVDSATTCSPMVDAVQPLHDSLSMRLFRT